jgi:hypothetical protein
MSFIFLAFRYRYHDPGKITGAAMQSLEVTEIQITKADLTRIDPIRLGFLVTAAHTCNELSVLRTIMLFEMRDDQGSDAVKSYTTVRWMTLARIALSKIHEFDISVGNHIQELRKSDRGKADAFLTLKRERLGKGLPQWVADIRNRLAFHFNISHVRECVSRIPDEAVLSFYMSESIGHTAFMFAEQAVSEPLFAELGADESGEPDLSRGGEVVMSYMIRNISTIVEFVHDYLGHCLEEAVVPFNSRTETIDSRYFGDPDEVSNPLFVMPPSR